MIFEDYKINAPYFWQRLEEIINGLNNQTISKAEAKELLENLSKELLTIIKLDGSFQDFKELRKYQQIGITIKNLIDQL